MELRRNVHNSWDELRESHRETFVIRSLDVKNCLANKNGLPFGSGSGKWGGDSYNSDTLSGRRPNLARKCLRLLANEGETCFRERLRAGAKKSPAALKRSILCHFY